MSSAAVEETLAAVRALGGGRYEEVEVFAKRGRSRRLDRREQQRLTVYSREQGWAVRAGDPRGSFFAAGQGAPDPAGPWPEADGRPLRLPGPVSSPPWSEPSDFEAPLIGEGEGHALLDALATALAREVDGARLVHAALEDGAYEIEVVNNRGLEAAHRGRLASLHLEAVDRSRPGVVASLYLAEREARRFEPGGLARRLADLLTVRRQGRTPERDRGELLLAPPVMVRMLEGLLPLFVGAEAPRRASELQNRRGKLGSEVLTVLDNGRLPGGVLEAPVDGEGVATREVLLVDRGAFRQALVPWWEARDPELRATGCSRRPGWRDQPKAGPTHLYLRPRAGVRAGELLEQVARGYYLMETDAAGSFDLEADAFSLPVCGFEVRAGRATAPIAGCVLTGSIGAFLHGLQAVARDLRFLPGAGMIGSPSALVTGLELRAR
ncbi:MAG: hypothetical protein KDD11_15125 [Acidobacteria bacterium]|nr:hypothetical protein [Acidobacteriota bacterium]